VDGREWQQEEFDRLAALTLAHFVALVGTDVSLVDRGDQVLTVVEADRYRRADDADPPDGTDRPFYVVLAGTAEVDLAQGMHATDLPGIGVVPLFLVPDGPADDGHHFVATFG